MVSWRHWEHFRVKGRKDDLDTGSVASFLDRSLSELFKIDQARMR